MKSSIKTLMSDSLIEKLLFFIFISSSFDVFMNINIIGFSLRTVLLLIAVFVVIVIIRSRYQPIYLEVIGGKYLLIWFLLLLCFIPNSTFIERNILYMIWFLWYIIFLVTLPIFTKTLFSVNNICNLYLISFYCLAIVGITQFFLGIIGIDFYIEQWWIEGFLPRINGFSYEPSYYASYMMIGWGMTFYNNFFSEKKVRNKSRKYLILMTVAILLSSSRMGLATMIITAIGTFGLNLLLDLIVGKIQLKIIKYLIFIMLFLSITANYVYVNFEKYDFLFSGTGIGNTASHSADERTDRAIETFGVFLKNPIIGVSLGGIPSGIAQQNGVTLKNQDQAKDYEGQNIYAEVLAASGLFGFLFFSLYFFTLFKRSFLLAKKVDIESGHILKSLLLGLVLCLFILFFNQTILRPWLWIHISVLNATYFFLLTKGLEVIR
jgi:hypothetical protein